MGNVTNNVMSRYYSTRQDRTEKSLSKESLEGAPKRQGRRPAPPPKLASLTGSCVLCGHPRGGDDVACEFDLVERSVVYIVCRACYSEARTAERAEGRARAMLKEGRLSRNENGALPGVA